MADWAVPTYNRSVDEFKEREYPTLGDSVYLDHAGTTPYSKSLVERFAYEMTTSLFGNPHSGSASSQLSSSRIEDIRLRALTFFRADPAEFDLVFVANATAGAKLVLEAFRSHPDGYAYAYHDACHTSLVGIREEARESKCLDSSMVEAWLSGNPTPFSSCVVGSPILFAYTAQSHMDGRRYPWSWARRLSNARAESNTLSYTLVDAASLAATSPMDLSDAESSPDFVVLSFYKIFGFPDLGALIVRRSAESIFRHRKYFGGGTVDLVVAGKEEWHASKSQSLHERLEDGTLPFHSILALSAALDDHRRLYGTMSAVASHTAFLRQRLVEGLSELRHWNGQHVCSLYPQHQTPKANPAGFGPVVSFNVRNSQGSWVSLAEFEKLATLKKFHLRTGGLCSPGGISSALGLAPWEVKRNFSSGFRCGNGNDIISGKPTGVIRASLGAMSTTSDVDRFVSFILEFYRDGSGAKQGTPLTRAPSCPTLQVQTITVYPIKSCGGYRVPPNMPWEVRPEGLAWDREWCLVHRGSGQALSQKRYHRMARIRPYIDFEHGLLRISYQGQKPDHTPHEVSVPLSANPGVFDQETELRSMASRVCGESIAAQTYTSREINGFFTAILGVDCALARFPPGGQGPHTRYSKAEIQEHQDHGRQTISIPGTFPRVDLPSPPESDSEQQQRNCKILLSNESPILLVHTASVQALNEEIRASGGKAVSADSFRANVIVGPLTAGNSQPAYAEDAWKGLRIGQQRFKMMGSCRRCQMVCINQETGEKNEDSQPFITLAKTRRFDGKVFFGSHMCHTPRLEEVSGSQHPTIRTLDLVSIEV